VQAKFEANRIEASTQDVCAEELVFRDFTSLFPMKENRRQSGDSARAYELKFEEQQMSAYEVNAERITIQTDPYEVRASQEEFYLEETEEELRMILECNVTTSQSAEILLPDLDKEIEDLLTGDSDDPPLAEDQVEDLLPR